MFASPFGLTSASILCSRSLLGQPMPSKFPYFHVRLSQISQCHFSPRTFLSLSIQFLIPAIVTHIDTEIGLSVCVVLRNLLNPRMAAQVLTLGEQCQAVRKSLLAKMRAANFICNSLRGTYPEACLMIVCSIKTF